MAHSLAELNQMSQTEFTAYLGDVFEHTPEIAQQAWQARPFNSLDQLHQAMLAVVNQLSSEAQLALIRAHPDLGSRAKMAEASVQEQSGAGLNQLTPDEYERIQALNAAYRQKFEFPLIIAVKQQTKAAIFEAFEQRLAHELETERQRALAEIGQIAKFRLHARVDSEA
ncbi:MAG: 2-oxo-4-hydroxy-4-carboxy-5-ureidoimidazoline decarboxylase [Leptolyngbya sp. SIO4C1]|nr:2-oxo-4-hydroxy-4-carboxy-5-ureidoimidazoline decarboxylase [Leptolyngbya sp. SIO4C1]